jgi:hypothetical protein
MQDFQAFTSHRSEQTPSPLTNKGREFHGFRLLFKALQDDTARFNQMQTNARPENGNNFRIFQNFTIHSISLIKYF